MFNDDVIGKMKKGAILINTARGAIADTDAVARALESGQLGGCESAAVLPLILWLLGVVCCR